jgi:hypothetical protein
MAQSQFNVDVSVVLPCLDEAESVGSCVVAALDAMRAAGLRGEVVVADNGSTDGSASIAEAAGARVIPAATRGYGAALAAGIAAAQGTVVVMADADLTYPLEKLAWLVAPVIAGEADLVLGSRLDAATRASMPFLHRFVGTPALTYLVRRASGSGLQLTDSQSGFRAFRRDAMLGLGLQGSGMEFASEMIIRANGAGWRIDEIPTGYRERVGESKLNTFGDGWRHLRLILSLAPHLLLIGPGVVLGVLGVLMTVLSMTASDGVLTVGSLRWQPMFFGPMLLVVATCALLAGSVIAHRSVLLHDAVRRRYAFVAAPQFPKRSAIVGVLALSVGVAIDASLFFADVAGGAGTGRRFALAGVAQAFILIGLLVTLFGVLMSLVSTSVSYERAVSAPMVVDLRDPLPAAVGMDA